MGFFIQNIRFFDTELPETTQSFAEFFFSFFVQKLCETLCGLWVTLFRKKYIQ
jgi:hypothetical protein